MALQIELSELPIRINHPVDLDDAEAKAEAWWRGEPNIEDAGVLSILLSPGRFATVMLAVKWRS